MRLDKKTIILTGPSSGVGLDLLTRLSPRNTIIGLSRRTPPRDVLDRAKQYTHITVDLSDAINVASAIAKIRQRHLEGVDGLINCGAVQFTPRFVDEDFDPALIGQEIAINLTSPIELVAGLFDLLSRGTDPFVMNVNSGLGLVPKQESAVYCATKAGLDNFTRAMRPQFDGTGIKMQQVFLPLVDTPMTEGRGSGKMSSSEVAAQIISAIEQGRPDTDIGRAKLLRLINRLSPSLAHRIMQKGVS